ncbi:MAG: hypothetical protein V1792_24965 [Pseudomonadota bacterium]
MPRAHGTGRSGESRSGELPAWQSEILLLGDGTVLVECGPMRMFMEASQGGIPRPDACRAAAGKAIGFLEEAALVKDSLSVPWVSCMEPDPGTPAHTMWHAVRRIGDADLTPMAAVAGTIAGATADFLAGLGMTRVLVNNGGDLALRLERDERVFVGIRPDVQGTALSHRVLITPETGIRGVATSGFGGRSFTRGTASAAVVLSADAAWADAAATAVGNATYVETRAVQRMRADLQYPDTDLKGVEVTVSVGELSEAVIKTALGQGIEKAEELVERDVIWGACIFVKGRMMSTGRLLNRLEPLA